MHSALLRVTVVALLVSIVLSLALVPDLGAERRVDRLGGVRVRGGRRGYLLALARGHARLRPSVAVLPRVALAGLAAVSAVLIPIASIAQWLIASAALISR